MKPVFLRSAFLLCSALLQVSLANILFSSWLLSLPILFSIIVSLTLLKGFTFSWKWAVLGGIFLDALALEQIGITSLELVLAAALLGFTAKELLFGYRVEKILFFGSIVWIFGVVMHVIETTLPALFSEKAFLFSFLLMPLSWTGIFWSFLVSIAIFSFAFPLTAIFERYLELFERTRVGR
jgi:hypothetical protein